LDIAITVVLAGCSLLHFYPRIVCKTALEVAAMRDLDGVGRRPGSPGSHELMPCCESWLAEQILEERVRRVREAGRRFDLKIERTAPRRPTAHTRSR